jgi:predicted hydrocarbon binding protein
MTDFVRQARNTQAILEQSGELSQQYWNSFNRDANTGRVTTEAGPKVIIPAKVLAINLFNTLDETLGEVGSHLVLYGIGKTWGHFSAEHFKEWAAHHAVTGEVVKYGALFFPMHVGLTPKLDLTEVQHLGKQYFVFHVTDSILSETRHKNKLDTEPAHWLVSGWLAGCMSAELNATYEARAIPNSGETSYRILVGLSGDIGLVDLHDPFWTGDLSAFESISIHA